jgi:rhomboid-like protein
MRQLQTRRSQNPSRQSLPQRASQTPPAATSQPEPQSHYTPDPNEENHPPGGQEMPNVRVRLLVPAIWAITVSTGIYISLAYFTAKSELKSKNTYNLFEGNSKPARTPSYSTYTPNGPPTPTEVVTRAWRDARPMSKLSWGLIGVNGAVHLSSLVTQRAWQHLWHIPATNRNYTLFTSTFVHSGPLHLGVNLYAIYNFLPATGYSRLFCGDTNHMLSFFLSTGVLSGLAQHFASTIFKQGRAYSTFISSGGASGALFAIFGAFCMEYPTQGVGIILVPYYIDAQYFLPIVMAFDLVGMIRGYSFVSFGHAVSSLIWLL